MFLHSRVGEAVVQVARMLGAEIAGSCSEASASRARELGVSTIYDYATSDLSEVRGVFDVVFDTSGALPVKTAMRMLNTTGVFLDINATPAKFLHAAFNRRHKIFNCSPTTQILAEVARAAVDGSLGTLIGETVPLESAVDLITDLEKGRKIGGKGIILMGADQ
ncbi:zinc-binding dehydrogenase [Nonomuraea sp. NPDC005650]|uniref:zinc-binding dehydrogenase n=1 Tax=Nonomuraea sp. NPDC005650 TaxID=3157045 RepID=UPI0033ACE605